jgi:hypothetical protein
MAAKSGKVALPDHPCRRRLHGGDVEVVVDVERPMPFQRPLRGVGPDPVAVDAPERVASRVEPRVHRTE